MASMVRHLTRSAVLQVRQPRWKELVQKSYKNLHLQAIYHQRRFSFCPDDGKDKEKNCIDYKKNPNIEDHEPFDLPKLKPKSPKLRIAKRRKFLKDKRCKDLQRELENDQYDKFSRICLLWGGSKLTISWQKINNCLMRLTKPRSLDQDLVFLSQERTFCQHKEQPVPPRSERMARKRRHHQAKQKKEAEAKAFAMLKHASNSNSETKKELQIVQSSSEAKQKKEAEAKAFSKLKHASNSNSQPKKELQIVQSSSEVAEEKKEEPPLDSAKTQDESSTNKEDLKRILTSIKERCKKKCEEFEKFREAERQKEAKAADQKYQNKMSEIKKLCQEARIFNAFKMARLQKLNSEAQLRKKSSVSRLRNQAEHAKLRNLSEHFKLRNKSKETKRDTTLKFKDEPSEDD
ncbi:hypothetical protein KR032_004098 [Drosophila birchii]|nr:hypothetical protein KR032_004098 [Drosophila birchii]